MKLVSVIIPYFKKKKYIADTLNSVLNQTYNNLEVIIVYDDQQKSDLDYIKKLASLDTRIKLIINSTNIGAGRSRNLGIEKSKGIFLAFIDADDIWINTKINDQINFMQEKNINFCHTDYKIVNEKKKFISIRKARNFFIIEDLIKSCDIGLSTDMMNKEIMGTNKFSELKTKEDFVLWLQLMSKNVRLYALNKELTLWRKTKNSLSSSPFQKILDGYKVYNVYMKFNIFKSLYYLLCLSLNYLKK